MDEEKHYDRTARRRTHSHSHTHSSSANNPARSTYERGHNKVALGRGDVRELHRDPVARREGRIASLELSVSRNLRCARPNNQSPGRRPVVRAPAMARRAGHRSLPPCQRAPASADAGMKRSLLLNCETAFESERSAACRTRCSARAATNHHRSTRLHTHVLHQPCVCLARS